MNDISNGGRDEKSIADLKKIIPREASSRGSIINTTDLNNFFNSINDDTNYIYFFKKRDNPFERLYYAYMITKKYDTVYPTNTLSLKLTQDDFIGFAGNNNLVSIKKQLRNYSIDGNEIASAEYIDYTFKKEKQWINSLFNPSTIQAGVSVKKYIDKQSAWTYTAAITGSYMFQLSKHNHGNTAGVYVNDRLICSYPFWGVSDTGTDLAQTDISWTPQVFVKKGDVIRIESDNETADGVARWYINSYNCSGIE
jgi:hypothetical protein